jgi:hypothetical protein
MLRGRMDARLSPAVVRPSRARFAAILGLGVTSAALFAAAAEAQIPRRRPPADAAATQPADAGPAPASRPVEEYSPPAEPIQRQPSGYVGKSPIRRGTPTSDFLPIPDRWRVGVPADTRFNSEPGAYGGGGRTGPLDPYKQNVLKGDYPIIGQDIFLALSATSDTLFEARRLPVPSGVSTKDLDSLAFFGAGRQYLVNQNFILSVELFQGDSVYRPRDWELRATPVFNYNYVNTQELGLVDPDVHEGRDRHDEWLGMQELFYEKHLGDLSVNYDFWAARIGIQGFTSDFRGFLFSDNEPGVRLFGTLDNNKLQWNIAYFNQLEKDTNSGLNAYSLRDQQVFIANVYRQDFLGLLGYTAQLSFHANLDDGDGQIDDNGVIVRPAPIGIVHEKQVNAYYFGWAGDGHIGRLNLTHQLYWAFGHESFNPIAQQEVDINAQFFAIELSYDQDWIRYRASFLYASGDDDPFDKHAHGFDSIFDNPNIVGGGTSLFVRQAIRLTGGGGVNVVNRNSLLPDLRTSKEQGQANFVNPGLFIYNVGADFDVTPKLKVLGNVSWLMFADTSTLQFLEHDDKLGKDIGLDYSVGVQYRPFLNNNAIINFGAAALSPGNGFKDLYNSQTLYSVFLGVTLSY